MKKNSTLRWIFLELFGVIFLSALICWAVYQDVSKVESFQTDVQALSAKDNLLFAFDTVEDNGADVSLQGWACIEGSAIGYFDCAIVLKKADADTYYRIPTTMVERKDVTAAFGSDEVNYDHAGFFARVEKRKIPAGEYEIYIEYNAYTNPVLYSTDQMITV